MSDDLNARLDAALRRQEQHEDGVRPDPAVLAELHARVVRARRGRTTSYAAVAAVAVGVLGVAGWFGLRHDTTPLPAHTPTPSPSATPTPAPTTASASPAATEPPPTPTSTPVDVSGMPALLSLPDGVLDAVGPDWVLLVYAPLVHDAPERSVLALAAPTGELYLVREQTGGVSPISWDGGRTVRAITWQPLEEGGARTVGDYDLLTGELVRDARIAVGDVLAGALPGGGELWFRPDQGASAAASRLVGDLRAVPRTGEPRVLATGEDVAVLSVSPDGARAVPETGPGAARSVLDVATGASTALAIPAGRTCDPVAWLDATSILATCYDDGDPMSAQPLDELNARVVRFDARTGRSQTLRTVTAADLAPVGGSWLSDGTAVVSHDPRSRAVAGCGDVCRGGAYLWSGDAMTPVPAVATLPDDVCSAHPGGDGVLVRTGMLHCYEEPGSSSRFWSVDLTTGSARPVGPTLGTPGALGVADALSPGRPGLG